jgi:hypothetical protein
MTWLKSQIGPLLVGLFVTLPLYLRWLYEATR